MRKFRKKPVVIEAVQWVGNNAAEIYRFMNLPMPSDGGYLDDHGHPVLVILTAEGNMIASVCDWIIRGVKGEFYPCKPDIFAATYDEVSK